MLKPLFYRWRKAAEGFRLQVLPGYLDADTEAMDRLLQMLTHAKSIMESLPGGSGSNLWIWRKNSRF